MVEEEKPQEEKRDTKPMQRFLKIISVFLGVVMVIILVVIKINVPEFPLRWVILIGALLVVAAVGTFFSFEMANYIKKLKKSEAEDKLPPAISIEECYRIAKNLLKEPRFAQEIRGALNQKTHTVEKGNNAVQVYELETEGVYAPYERYHVIINQHYSTMRNTVMVKPTQYLLRRAINSVAGVQVQEPDTEEETITDPLSGREITKRKKTYKKLQKRELKKEDLK